MSFRIFVVSIAEINIPANHQFFVGSLRVTIKLQLPDFVRELQFYSRTAAGGHINSTLSIIIHVTIGGVIQQLAVIGKTRTVTRTLPRMLCGISFQRAPHMRTARRGGSEQVLRGREAVHQKLLVPD